MPVHSGETIGPGLLNKILREFHGSFPLFKPGARGGFDADGEVDFMFAV